jgi:hypothetical protein
LKTFKRFVRVAVLGAFAAGSLVAVAAPAGAVTVLLSCDAVKGTSQINNSVTPPIGSSDVSGSNPAENVVTVVKGKQVGLPATCSGSLAGATGNLLKASAKLTGVGSCESLVTSGASPAGAWGSSGKVSWTFTNPTSSNLAGPAAQTHPSWTATAKLSAYVRLGSGGPALDDLSLDGIVTKGVAVGALFNGTIGFDPYTDITFATPVTLANLLPCAGGAPPGATIGGAQAFTDGTTNILGTSVSSAFEVTLP